MEELVGLLFALLLLYWVIKGTLFLFQRYHALLVIAYIVFIFPVAFIHAFFLGVFGKSQEELLREEAQWRQNGKCLWKKRGESWGGEPHTTCSQQFCNCL